MKIITESIKIMITIRWPYLLQHVQYLQQVTVLWSSISSGRNTSQSFEDFLIWNSNSTYKLYFLVYIWYGTDIFMYCILNVSIELDCSNALWPVFPPLSHDVLHLSRVQHSAASPVRSGPYHTSNTEILYFHPIIMKKAHRVFKV